MRENNWLKWCLIGLLTASCAWMTLGCSDDDDDEEAPGTTTLVVTNTVGGVTRTNTVVVTNPPAATPAPAPAPAAAPASRVLLDIGQGVAGDSGFGVMTDPTPAAGRVTITATWTCIDLIAGGASIDVPLEFLVNDGVAGAGGFHNAGANSPFTGAVNMPASLGCTIQVRNNVSDSMATVRLRAVWTP